MQGRKLTPSRKTARAAVKSIKKRAAPPKPRKK